MACARCRRCASIAFRGWPISRTGPRMQNQPVAGRHIRARLRGQSQSCDRRRRRRRPGGRLRARADGRAQLLGRQCRRPATGQRRSQQGRNGKGGPHRPGPKIPGLAGRLRHAPRAALVRKPPKRNPGPFTRQRLFSGQSASLTKSTCDHSMSCTSFCDCRSNARSCPRSSIAAFVYRPCFSAF